MPMPLPPSAMTYQVMFPQSPFGRSTRHLAKLGDLSVIQMVLINRKHLLSDKVHAIDR